MNYSDIVVNAYKINDLFKNFEVRTTRVDHQLNQNRIKFYRQYKQNKLQVTRQRR